MKLGSTSVGVFVVKGLLSEDMFGFSNIVGIQEENESFTLRLFLKENK